MMHEKKPKRIKAFSVQEIEEDIEKYRQKALELGVTDAKMVPADKIYVDVRVRIKCTIPKCPLYGSCAHCPPHSLDTEKIRELIQTH
jgi:predicted metal-binding protein